jgi:hypothetical protein
MPKDSRHGCGDETRFIRAFTSATWTAMMPAADERRLTDPGQDDTWWWSGRPLAGVNGVSKAARARLQGRADLLGVRGAPDAK